jgi:hypothetical protein
VTRSVNVPDLSEVSVRLVEIAELLGVTPADVRDRPTARVPRAGRPRRSEPPMGSARGRDLGEGVASREGVAIADREPH